MLVNTTISRVYREKFALKPKNDCHISTTPKEKTVGPIEPTPEIKLELSMNFKEFYRAHLGEIKHEIKMHKSKFMTYFANRGSKRLLEAKKYKILGEL